MKKGTNQTYVLEIKQIIQNARKKAYNAVNTAMIEAYWLVGKRIVEEEQNGSKRANYGKEILVNLSNELLADLGKGYSVSNLKNFRQFFLTFPNLIQIRQTLSGEFNAIGQTLSAQFEKPVSSRLSEFINWSHYQLIMRVKDENARAYYLKETALNNWSVRTLERNISTLYYQRLLSSQSKNEIEKEMKEKNESNQNESFEFIKNPSVLEFLNLPVNLAYTEAEFEKALIDNLQKFILELGKGYAFIARQQLVRTETANFYIDLVFYNYILKCFVIVELKTHKITHQDIGQLDMYVRMFNDLRKQESDNPTIGILLCTETDKTIAKYSVLSENQQLFATKYLPYLPTENELINEIEKGKRYLIEQFENKQSNK